MTSPRLDVGVVDHILLFMRAVTVESTMMVRTKSPTSAVSPPVEWMLTPKALSSAISSSVPLMMADSTHQGLNFVAPDRGRQHDVVYRAYAQ